jgi:NAD(P)-dependent dehydrogenase (short-subunit alcohol dehydrogenase family)
VDTRAGEPGQPSGFAIYCVATVNLTRELGLQYAKQGIQVNALCPGFYQTNLSRGAIDDP